ncbi:MAG: hypothetical protein MUF50_03620 [Planctomycetes bacterium]|jgi:hypothetical protein|nr:hypothetical protein [Planctomycetota bacterium]
MKQLATISILVEDRQANSMALHETLSDHGHIIMARLGVNIEPTCFDKCTGMIILAIKATHDEMADFMKTLALPGLTVKMTLFADPV